MPKAPRDAEELAEFKNRILDVAAEVIGEEGYKNLSMRKIATRMNMAAPSLYYYFRNKDEINIAIRRRAGSILFDKLSAACESNPEPEKRVRSMIGAYLGFGLENPQYYEVMFDSAAPKFTDYVGTGMEEAARDELESSIRSLTLMKRCVEDLAEAGYRLPEEDGITEIAIWSQLHGIVSLHNNNLLTEVGYFGGGAVEKTADLFFKMIFSFLENNGGGKA